MECEEVLKKLKSFASQKTLYGMARFGIDVSAAYGVKVPILRKIKKEIGNNHILALKLWETGIHEARLLASMIDDPKKVTKKQFNNWTKDFNSWDICDQVCGNLFDKTDFVCEKIFEYSKKKNEFEKRTAFALIACLAVHNKEIKDNEFEKFFKIIKRESCDERNFVKKAINWALRQIGKRNIRLNKKAILIAKQIQKIDSKSAKWIANDAIRELTSSQIQKRLK
ncbi:MAG: DNA alkylation repair protein [Patescibacteria group bacterium]|nr:DNA alkylation repair protein [Patescibacteria group bacterium]